MSQFVGYDRGTLWADAVGVQPCVVGRVTTSLAQVTLTRYDDLTEDITGLEWQVRTQLLNQPSRVYTFTDPEKAKGYAKRFITPYQKRDTLMKSTGVI